MVRNVVQLGTTILVPNVNDWRLHTREPVLDSGLEWTGAGLNQFPSMRWPTLYRILARDPLNYSITRQDGSHRTLEAEGRPVLHLSFHDSQELPGGMVRKILCKDIGLSQDEARKLL